MKTLGVVAFASDIVGARLLPRAFALGATRGQRKDGKGRLTTSASLRDKTFKNKNKIKKKGGGGGGDEEYRVRGAGNATGCRAGHTVSKSEFSYRSPLARYLLLGTMYHAAQVQRTNPSEPTHPTGSMHLMAGTTSAGPMPSASSCLPLPPATADGEANLSADVRRGVSASGPVPTRPTLS